MKKLTSKGWNKNRVKLKGFEWFNIQVENRIEREKISKPSEAQIRKVYQEITGEKAGKPVKKKEIKDE